MDKACLSSSLCGCYQESEMLQDCRPSLLSAGQLSTQVVLEFKRGVSLALYGPSVPLAACHCKTVTRGSPPPAPCVALQSWEAQLWHSSLQAKSRRPFTRKHFVQEMTGFQGKKI